MRKTLKPEITKPQYVVCTDITYALIIVMCEGKVTGNIDISEATQEHIMNKATRNID